MFCYAPHSIKQNTSTQRQSSHTVSRQQTWRDSWTSWPNVRITKSLCGVFKSPLIVIRGCFLQWELTSRTDLADDQSYVVILFTVRQRGRLESWRSLVLPDCLWRINNDSIVLRCTPKCLATMLCVNPAWSIPISWRRWFSVRRGITLKSMSFKQKCFSDL
jgi:hypothetical protein